MSNLITLYPQTMQASIASNAAPKILLLDEHPLTTLLMPGAAAMVYLSGNDHMRARLVYSPHQNIQALERDIGITSEQGRRAFLKAACLLAVGTPFVLSASRADAGWWIAVPIVAKVFIAVFGALGLVATAQAIANGISGEEEHIADASGATHFGPLLPQLAPKNMSIKDDRFIICGAEAHCINSVHKINGLKMLPIDKDRTGASLLKSDEMIYADAVRRHYATEVPPNTLATTREVRAQNGTAAVLSIGKPLQGQIDASGKKIEFIPAFTTFKNGHSIPTPIVESMYSK